MLKSILKFILKSGYIKQSAAFTAASTVSS